MHPRVLGLVGVKFWWHPEEPIESVSRLTVSAVLIKLI